MIVLGREPFGRPLFRICALFVHCIRALEPPKEASNAGQLAVDAFADSSVGDEAIDGGYGDRGVALDHSPRGERNLFNWLRTTANFATLLWGFAYHRSDSHFLGGYQRFRVQLVLKNG